jgi:hypothetical protein
MLPDDALLEMFSFYLGEDPGIDELEEWHILVHVCRKWRIVVFGSPRRLNLQLHCGTRNPARQLLGVWPVLPIIVWDWNPTRAVDNVIAALERNDRVCQIELGGVPSLLLENVLAAMQEPFLELTSLQLWSKDDDEAPVISDSFLGGSAPRLQYLDLNCLPYLGLPLMSATHLVTLHLLDIPHSGYISSKAMLTALSALANLETFDLRFQSPLSRPDRESRRPLPPTRSVLPTLKYFKFRGVSEYLEDLVALVDAPILDRLHITFFHQFICRTPHLRPQDEARVTFFNSAVVFTLPGIFERELELGISCRQSDWQLSSLAQICSLSFPRDLVFSLERLYTCEGQHSQLRWQDDVENSEWPELLQPFTAVKELYLSQGFAPCIAPVLQELVGERVGEVLPALQSLFLEELHPSRPVQEAIEKFVAMRQLSSHPISVSHWDRVADSCRAVARAPANPAHRCVPGLHMKTAPKLVFGAS